MRLIFFLICIFGIPIARAADEIRYQAYLNPELRYEREANQQMIFRHPLNVGFGAQLDNTTYIIEVSHFTETSGNQTLSIDRTHYETAFWINYNLYQFGSFNFFAGAGAGIFRETVKTNLNGNSSVDVGEVQPLVGTSVGLKALLWKHLILSAEGRFLVGQNFDPNPQLGMLLRVGVEF